LEVWTRAAKEHNAKVEVLQKKHHAEVQALEAELEHLRENSTKTQQALQGQIATATEALAKANEAARPVRLAWRVFLVGAVLVAGATGLVCLLAYLKTPGVTIKLEVGQAVGALLIGLGAIAAGGSYAAKQLRLQDSKE
jgi:predicted RecB family nuclease